MQNVILNSFQNPSFITSVFDFFLPRFCPGCKAKLKENENTVCFSCIDKIQLASSDRITYEFRRKFSSKNIISGFISAYVFEKDKELQNIIHSLKYNKRFLTGVYFGQLLGNQIKEKIHDWKVELIIPIPLHHLKKAERGYNQSYYIAKGLSKKLGIKMGKKIVKRKKFTLSQTSMNLKEREENLSDAFFVRKKKDIKNKNILLVDDVITTGATISECGKVLLNAKAKKVYAASIAIADFN